jgi:L-2-hydroxyglutarate oxidase LhgO
VAGIETIVVGAGVLGLAIARELAQRGQEVMVLEQHDLIGSETSARNSEVIHAGIYYPQNSLKARACVEGKWLLYDYCRARNVPCSNLGKLIVATTTAQVETLKSIRDRAAANGVGDLELLTQEKALALEPHLVCEAALLSPSTGIVDSHALMLALQGDFETAGGQVVLRTPVRCVEQLPGEYRLQTGLDEDFPITCNNLIVAAGHGTAPLLSSLAGYRVPRTYYARGCYFSVTGGAPFSRLIYPVPEHGGLGVHLTLDLAGQARFGPDVEWIDALDYTVDPSRADRFYEEIRRYWPDLADDSLSPDYSGIRPKISGPGEPAADFRIDGPATHGHRGLVALFGIESPGLTACLCLARETANALERA